MRAIHVQYLLALIFLGLGSWTMLFPGTVEELVLRQEFYMGTDASRLLLACFGAQAVLCGIVILTSKFTPATFLVFGLLGSVPFFGFNYYFYFIKGMFTEWMLLDFVGNIGILACGIFGYRMSKKEAISTSGK